jgi:ribonuclease VapC
VTVPFAADRAAVTREAFLRYGKGRHPAALNFGDCIAYATARLEAMPLLLKDDDFRLTDVEPAI